MGTIETDYLVIGAGATGMAFADALVEDADVNEWLMRCRLTRLGNAGEHLAEPDAMGALVRMLEQREATVENLERILAADAVPSSAGGQERSGNG